MSAAGSPALAEDDLESSLLRRLSPPSSSYRRRTTITAVAVVVAVGIVVASAMAWGRTATQGGWGGEAAGRGAAVVESEVGVVAADDERCSEIGAWALRAGGHAADAAVAATICLGVVNPTSSGIGGGAFIVVRSSEAEEAIAIDARETAPAAASQDMYEQNPSSKSNGALSMGIPGELAGLHAAWIMYGRLQWKSLLEPSVKLARDGFTVSHYLAHHIKDAKEHIMADPGLRNVFAPNGNLLGVGDICHNPKLARTLETVSNDGPQAFYNGNIGREFIEDVRNVGGIATLEDLQRYKIKVTKALSVKVLGYTVLGMSLPSSGTLGLSLVLNILGSYKSADAAKGFLGVHRLIEALKHMFAIRMNLGDPGFVHVTKYEDAMLSASFAEKIKEKIQDNTTHNSQYYFPRWSQLDDHGTSHLCVVDADRNAVSLTTTVNFYFGAKVLSPSTGIVLNNEMDDFSTPTEVTPDELPPAPANFIQPNKRPLSSMTPIIILKDNQLAGVIGGSGGLCIIPAVVQVFLNHFILGMSPLAAVQHPRVYTKLIPNVVQYENWTAYDGEKFELSKEAKLFLQERGHILDSSPGIGSVSQLVVQNLKGFVVNDVGREYDLGGDKKSNVLHGMLTAVCDPRKGGRPAGL